MAFSPPVTLALDCALKGATVAVLRDGDLVASRQTAPGGQHSLELLPLLGDVINDAGISWDDIGRVIYSAGPGGFTSLRVGLATLSGLFAGFAVKAIAVSSLRLRCASLHLQMLNAGRSVPVHVFAMRAGMGEVYAGRLDLRFPVAHVFQEACVSHEIFLKDFAGLDSVMMAGEGLRDIAALLNPEKIFSLDDVVSPEVFADLVRAETNPVTDISHLTLNYLKDPVRL